ncbi:alpha/beta fold hydrolase [Nocardia sp. NBC_00511]|uniref:alpha/beta fold hydrolase n=1 Tax=Nocardia sp. NBC_00511 TaxID=2903591 RepID=UPI0030E472B9
MDELYFTRRGQGEPLLLIHGLGDDHHAWDRVVPLLSGFDVVAVDLPGHGKSARLGGGVRPTPDALRNSLIGLLDRLGIERAHVAGNSLGGWMALELGRVGRARSLSLLSPAGLWTGRERVRNKVLFSVAGVAAGNLEPLLRSVVRTSAGRAAVLFPIAAHPRAVPVEAAESFVAALAGAAGFYDTRRAVQESRFRGGRDISVPVTVAFGAKDLLLTPDRGQCGEELPAHAVWSPLPECGHVPMLDDPEAVAAVIRTTIGRVASV